MKNGCRARARQPSFILCVMGMLDDPLLHFDGQPKAVNAQSNDGQKKPLDVVAEQLTARAVKGQSLAVNDRVAREPALLDANGPRHTDAEGDTADQPLQQIDTDQADQASRKFRFHIKSSFDWVNSF